MEAVSDADAAGAKTCIKPPLTTPTHKHAYNNDGAFIKKYNWFYTIYIITTIPKMHLRLFHRTRSVVDGGVRRVARRLHLRTPSGRRYPPWRVIYERKVMLNVENRHWRVTIVCFYALTMLTTTDNPANIVPVVATVQMRVSWLYFGPCGRSHF